MDYIFDMFTINFLPSDIILACQVVKISKILKIKNISYINLIQK